MTTEKQQTVCDGKINQAGYCNKCYQAAQTSGDACGRLIPVDLYKNKQLLQTPLQKLITFIDKEQGMFKDSFVLEIKNKAKALLQEEKHMVIDAHGEEKSYLSDSGNFERRTGEQYYTETYGDTK